MRRIPPGRHFVGLIILGVGVAASSVVGLTGCGGPLRPYEKARIRQAVKASESDILFHGKVLDQDDVPVEGATVRLAVRAYHQIAEMRMGDTPVNLQTDSKGCFTVSGVRGIALSLQGIEREGYEYSLNDNPRRSFEYDRASTGLFHSDPENPVAFRLWKRDVSRFYLYRGFCKYGGGVRLALPGLKRCEGFELNILDCSIQPLPIDRKKRISKRSGPDVKGFFTCTPNKIGVTLHSLQEGCGIIAFDAKPSRLPVDGYSQTAEISLDVRKEEREEYVWFGLRSRNGEVYGLACLYVLVRKHPSFELSIAVSPYGERDFNFGPEGPEHFDPDLRMRIQREVRESIRLGRPPKEFDMKLLSDVAARCLSPERRRLMELKEKAAGKKRRRFKWLPW